MSESIHHRHQPRADHLAGGMKSFMHAELPGRMLVSLSLAVRHASCGLQMSLRVHCLERTGLRQR